MTVPFLIDDFLTDKHYWCKTEDGNFHIDFQGPTGLVTTQVTGAQLALLHPLFPVAVAYQSDKSRKKYKHGLLGSATTRATLAFFLEGTVTFAGVTGLVVNKVNTDSISIDEQNSKRVYVYGCNIRIETVTKDDGTHRLPVFIGWLGTPVKKDELEKCYPGWEQRWKIGQELGVTGEALMQHVFNLGPAKHVVPNTATDAINFE